MGDALRVRLLGGLEVEGVDPRALGSRKGRRLLSLLALTAGRAIPTDRIVDIVWGDDLPARPGDQVSVLVSRLRQTIGADRLRKTDAGYAVDLDWVDLDALRELVDEGDRRLAAGSWRAARAAADAALALVRGPLLPEEPDAEWCEAQRGESLRLAGRARHAAASAALAAGDLLAAADVARSALDTDAYDESALRLYMTACAAAGRPALALSTYAETRVLLRDDLGASPAAETEAVHAAVLAEQVPDGYLIGGSRAVPAAGGRAELPGRAAELALLDAALARAADGTPEIVVVEGEAGIGKTRLISDWTVGVPTSCTVLSARCDELGRAMPFQPLFDALSAYLRGQQRDDVAQLLGDEAPLLGPLLGVGGSTEQATLPSGEGIAQAVLHAALLSLAERIAAAGVVVLCIDDGHLADEATAAWIRLVRQRASGLRLLVVVARRPEEGPRVDATTTLSLGPLDRAAAVVAVGAEQAAAVYERSGGHPLFLVELASAEDVELPASLRDAVSARCERAGADVAATVRAAAVLGPVVDLDLLGAVLGRPPGELLDHLEEGARRRLLEERGATFVFHHALIREALAASTSASRRALLHREAARVLDARVNAPPLSIAYHARLGGDHRLAARALAAAADVATARFDYDEAIRLLDEAVSLEDTAALRRARAHAHFRTSQPADGAPDATAALAADPCAASYEVASLAAYFARDFDRALGLADEGARVAVDNRDRASCLAVGGRIAMALGELDGSTERLARADVSQAPPVVATTVRVISGWLAYQRGDFTAALGLLANARRPTGEDQLWSVHILQFQALSLAGSGRPTDALAVLDEQDQAAERLHMRRVAGRADNCRGYVLRGLGAFDLADEANQRGLEAATRVEQLEAQAHSLLDLADGRLLRGDLAGAGEYLDRAAPFQEVPHSLRWRHLLRTQLLRGRLALADGRADDARAAAAAVLSDATRRSVARYEIFGRLLAAQAALVAADTVDLDAVAADLDRLDAVAGLEAWRVTLELADAGNVAAWRRLAENRLAALVSAAGPHADTLRAYATTRL